MHRAIPIAVSLLSMLLLAGTAQAACTSSTPSAAGFSDSPFDGELGLAPEIVSAEVSAVTASLAAAERAFSRQAASQAGD